MCGPRRHDRLYSVAAPAGGPPCLFSARLILRGGGRRRAGDYPEGEGWQVQLSETLQFLDSSRRCRLIKGRHDELCYLPFYEKIDLYYYFEDAGYDQYTLYQRPQGRWMLSEEALTNTCGNQDEPWAMLDFDQNVAEEKAMFPSMIVNGVHQRQTCLEAGMRLQFAAITVLIHPAFYRGQQPRNAAQNQAEAAALANLDQLDVPAAR